MTCKKRGLTGSTAVNPQLFVRQECPISTVGGRLAKFVELAVGEGSNVASKSPVELGFQCVNGLSAEAGIAKNMSSRDASSRCGELIAKGDLDILSSDTDWEVREPGNDTEKSIVVVDVKAREVGADQKAAGSDDWGLDGIPGD